MWVEVMCANFWVQKYLILFPHLLADTENYKDLEGDDAKKNKKKTDGVWIPEWLLV